MTLGIIVLPLITIFAQPAALPAERLTSGYCANVELADGSVGWGLPCDPVACVNMFCEEGLVRDDGSLVCLDVDEVYPAGHWVVDDFQEDSANPDDSIHYTVEY